MKIMLVGKDGMIGKSLQTYLKKKNLIAFGKNEFNLEDKNKILEIIEKYRPDIFINAAAFTNVNLSENFKTKVKKINSDSLKIIAKKIKSINSLLIHYSTDYVFDGNKRLSYSETDKTNPLQYYGKTKKIAEENIRKVNCKHIILRTSWIYSKNGNNFVNKIINQKHNLSEIKVVNDEYGTPTSSNFVAKHTLHICNKYILNDFHKSYYGIYNLSPKGITSRYSFAKHILKSYNINKKIIPIKNNSFKNLVIVKRPRKVYLSKNKFSNIFKSNIIHWKTDFEKNMNK